MMLTAGTIMISFITICAFVGHKGTSIAKEGPKNNRGAYAYLPAKMMAVGRARPGPNL